MLNNEQRNQEAIRQLGQDWVDGRITRTVPHLFLDAVRHDLVDELAFRTCARHAGALRRTAPSMMAIHDADRS